MTQTAPERIATRHYANGLISAAPLGKGFDSILIVKAVEAEYVHIDLVTDQDATIAALVEALKRLERICIERQPDKIADGVKIARDAIAAAKGS